MEDVEVDLKVFRNLLNQEGLTSEDVENSLDSFRRRVKTGEISLPQAKPLTPRPLTPRPKAITPAAEMKHHSPMPALRPLTPRLPTPHAPSPLPNFRAPTPRPRPVTPMPAAGEVKSRAPEEEEDIHIDVEEENRNRRKRLEKMEILHMLKRMNASGFSKLSMDTPLCDLRMELQRVKEADDDVENVRKMKFYLCVGVAGLDFVQDKAKKYHPFKLEGWGASTCKELQQPLTIYDKVLLKIWLKYFRHKETNPLIELGLLLLNSMVMYHIGVRPGNFKAPADSDDDDIPGPKEEGGGSASTHPNMMEMAYKLLLGGK
jgi:hypothetical protein